MKQRILLDLALACTSATGWAQMEPQSEADSKIQTANPSLAAATEEPAELPTIKVPEQPSAPETLAQLTQPAPDATSVKVIVQKKQTIEEYRQRGELVLVKVIPNDGVPYYIDPLERDKENASGKDLLNSGVKPVRWVLKEF
ncbi:DUF2782 domain-containing protein [Marinicella meishanensis]|uniref:DUF2782 domain-containing protein n=1 Tax=Marinicella meishanensis TaxID=2873263 RepID=UPI001CBC66E4|nr:DUF2782 domain-containing protein [Marinicella sp. NBU2979]